MKVQHLNASADSELQEQKAKLEKRQEAMKDLLKIKEDLFLKTQKL